MTQKAQLIGIANATNEKKPRLIIAGEGGIDFLADVKFVMPVANLSAAVTALVAASAQPDSAAATMMCVRSRFVASRVSPLALTAL